jgi:hypothetical protein
MKTEIIKIKGDWQEVVDDCRTTVGKESLGKEPSKEFKRCILIAEHSPIRDISFKWRWRNMAHWITVHWVRHKWEKFVRTQRTDRTGIDRNKLTQDEPQTFVGEANTQNLIDTMRKRLCFMASKETREYAEDLKTTIHGEQPEIADVLVPNCIYRCGCPEMNGCGWYDRMLQKHLELKGTSIQERYDAYNNIFYDKMR